MLTNESALYIQILILITESYIFYIMTQLNHMKINFKMKNRIGFQPLETELLFDVIWRVVF